MLTKVLDTIPSIQSEYKKSVKKGRAFVTDLATSMAEDQYNKAWTKIDSRSKVTVRV